MDGPKKDYGKWNKSDTTLDISQKIKRSCEIGKKNKNQY